MGTLIVHPENGGKAPYNRQLLEKIKRSEKDFKAGKYKVIKTGDLWNENISKNPPNK
jgi:hypothetical protein